MYLSWHLSSAGNCGPQSYFGVDESSAIKKSLKIPTELLLPDNVSPLSCEPPAGVNGRLEEDQDPRASLVNCSGWLCPGAMS